jgi:hypothetical protein
MRKFNEREAYEDLFLDDPEELARQQLADQPCWARSLLNRFTRYTKNHAYPATNSPTSACAVDRRFGSLIQ